ncbi:unnamed protein product, partial [Chrysoparadoxa australica]
MVAMQGYYTVDDSDEGDRYPWLSVSMTMTSLRMCEKGYYCRDGIRTICPPGTWGGETGLSSSSCSGLCPPGYICPQGSILPTSIECSSPDVYCPEGSSLPTTVEAGYYSTGGASPQTHSTQ